MKQLSVFSLAMLLVATVTGSSQEPAKPATAENIKWQVLSDGGISGTSTSYHLGSTVGQTAAGLVTSTNYLCNQGYWQNFCCTGPRGNVNAIGIIDLSDLSLLIAFLTASSHPTLPCPEAANVNGLAIVDLSDLSLLIAYLTANPRPSLPPCP